MLAEAFPEWKDAGVIGLMADRAMKAAKLVDENPKSTPADHAIVHGMLVNTAKFLVPQLKNQEIDVSGELETKVEVTIRPI
jgi:hypothetical protein